MFELKPYEHKVLDWFAVVLATKMFVSRQTGCWMVPLLCVFHAGTPWSRTVL